VDPETMLSSGVLSPGSVVGSSVPWLAKGRSGAGRSTAEWVYDEMRRRDELCRGELVAVACCVRVRGSVRM